MAEGGDKGYTKDLHYVSQSSLCSNNSCASVSSKSPQLKINEMFSQQPKEISSSIYIHRRMSRTMSVVH